MAKYVNGNGLKRALAGFWVGAKAYIDGIKTALENAIALKQDILGFWGVYDKETNKVATQGAVEGVTGLLSNLTTIVKTTLVGAINEVKASVDTLTTDSAVTVTAAEVATEGYLKTYNVYQGGSDEAHKVGSIDIPKDLVVTAGEVVKNPAGQPAGTYIKLTIANQSEPLYINVKDLVDIYTAAKNAAQVQVAVSDTNEISATIVAKSVTNTELSDAVNASLALADSALQAADLLPYRTAEAQDAIDATHVAKTQTIAGVDLQDNITKAEMLTALNVADGATKDEALTDDEIDAIIAEIFPAE